ncbi:DUF2303 family protein [Segeticoccus rhizosphaerae]|uniref:DUF2303 family protein n=1 Tax=Segeticoccus rhizosphaerae TaxID=1104777 RepID=UPI001264CC2F|nr:DUF2303 family protein [Segeticoccus rhizosphaerae]
MPENTENYDLIETAQEAVGAQELYPGIYWSGKTAKVIDIREQLHDEQSALPDRKTGRYTVTIPEAFAGYLAKHGLEQTEVWGSRDSGTITAVINGHGSAVPDHEDHTLTLQLRHSDDWKQWIAADGKLTGQLEFAEFIEDHLPNFALPSAADMLELAQTFQATTKVDFASSQRVKSGETQLNYAEQQTASAGKKGQLAIPDTFTIGVRVYDQIGDPYKITARFRYRIHDGQLRLGYRLTRPGDVLQAAFDDVTSDVTAATGRDVWATT